VLGDFVTERLALRPLSSEDLDRLADLNRDGGVMRFITGRPSSIDETAVELEVALGTRWLAFAREDGGFLGWVGAIDAHRTRVRHRPAVQARRLGARLRDRGGP
jgi:RimJ/RimL family protein N-acetyltransferase